MDRKPRVGHCVGENSWQVCTAWLEIHSGVLYRLGMDATKLTSVHEVFDDARRVAQNRCTSCTYASRSWQRDVMLAVKDIPRFSKVLCPGLVL